MKHAFASDCHNHSVCSPDGSDSVEAMLLRARELGLYAYTVTDHCECQKYEERRGSRGENTGKALSEAEYMAAMTYRSRVQTAWAEMEQAAQNAEGLRFYRGIELGQPNQDPAGAEDALAGRAFDFVIGSIHNIRGFEDFFFLDYSDVPPDFVSRLLTTYFEELLEVIAWGGFDSLGHLTYPLRYIEGDHGIPVDLSRHRAAIDKVLSELIRTEKALEVNTSGLRQKLGRTLPDLPLLRRYYELGGRLVTLGSDAHSTADLGKGIDEGMELLKQAGFTEFAVYRQREPVLLPLE